MQRLRKRASSILEFCQRRAILTHIFVVLLWCAVAVSTALLVRLLVHGGQACQVDYTAVGELLLVFVIALEGLVAISELTHNLHSTKVSANAAVFDLYKTYLSIDYQEKVRRTAWFALWKANSDPAYRQKLLAGLAGELPDRGFAEVYERRQAEGEKPPTDQESWLLEEEYHRVQDILGFFTTLSRLNAGDIIQICNFFYDRWRPLLHWIVGCLGEYRPLGSSELANLKERRYAGYKKTLDELDDLFCLKNVSWKEDPLFQASAQTSGGGGEADGETGVA